MRCFGQGETVDAERWENSKASWQRIADLDVTMASAYESGEQKLMITMPGPINATCMPGEWVVKDASGKIKVMSDAQFRKDYEPKQ